jgi:NADPH2:quinone reductase
MHAWLCENPVGVDALTWKELPTPAPKAGEVLIEIKAASLNFPDLLIVQNKYQMKPPLPFVPGSEYAGVVRPWVTGVTNLKVGQNVACLSGTGGFGTHTIAPAALCMPLPSGFSHVDAAAFIMIYATSATTRWWTGGSSRPAKPCWCWALPAAWAPPPSRSPRPWAPR